MRKLTLLMVMSLAMLMGCNKERTTLNLTDQALTLRSGSDCTDFCNLSDPSACCDNLASNCADLAGTRPISIELGPPPLTMTGQKPPMEGALNFNGLCGNPADGPPFSINLTGGFTGKSGVVVASHLGRIQSVSFNMCLRPYILPSFEPYIPDFLRPIQFEDYPPCNDMIADYVMTSANGDELWFQIETDSYPDCDNEELYILEGKWTITGGTGRFAEATGGGCINGTGWANLFDPNPGAPDKWFLEGGIDY